MTKKTILLIGDDPKTSAAVKEELSGYEVEAVSKAEAAADAIGKKAPALIVFDLDLKGVDPLQVFRQISLLAPQVKFIMLSSSGSIPLAVSATRLGAADFLRKPLQPKQLKTSVEENILKVESLWAPIMIDWLQGESPKIKKMLDDIRNSLSSHNRMILLGERGIEKGELVGLIHANSLKKKRKMQALDLASFRRENLEAHFWSTLQEIMAEPEISSLRSEEDLCGTLYLENLESLEDHFIFSILNFLKERKGKVDKEILTVFGIYDRSFIQKVKIQEYALVEIPFLRERKEDLPYLLSHYLKKYSTKLNKPIRGISSELLNFVSSYDYPGNYKELETLVEQAVLSTASEVIELRDLPLGFRDIADALMNKIFRTRNFKLQNAKNEFEKNLYRALLSKTEEDVAAAARFLDIPRTTLAERIETLGQDFLN